MDYNFPIITYLEVQIVPDWTSRRLFFYNNKLCFILIMIPFFIHIKLVVEQLILPFNSNLM